MENRFLIKKQIFKILLLFFILLIFFQCSYINSSEGNGNSSTNSSTSSTTSDREGNYTGGNNNYAGINLGNALEAPNEGEWGVVLEESYFDKIKDAGFKYVRIPIRWSNHALTNSPYTIDTTFMDRVKWAVDESVNRNMITIINIHHYEEIMGNPDGHKARFLSLWNQIANEFINYSNDYLYFEILNEPNDNLTPAKWNQFLSEAVSLIRSTGANNLTRKLIIGTANWGGISGLSDLILPSDNNLIVTVHYYNPFQFTHQGADWVAGSNAWLGTTWSATEQEKQAVRNDLDTAVNWQQNNGNVPLFLGEFGAYSKANMSDRARWTAFVAREAETRGIFWTYWEFCSGFGAYNKDTNKWKLDLIEALLPK